MLIIKRGEKESIDKLLKKFKRKTKETQLIKSIRKGKEFIKPSTIKRRQKQKAIYNQKRNNNSK